MLGTVVADKVMRIYEENFPESAFTKGSTELSIACLCVAAMATEARKRTATSTKEGTSLQKCVKQWLTVQTPEAYEVELLKNCQDLLTRTNGLGTMAALASGLDAQEKDIALGEIEMDCFDGKLDQFTDTMQAKTAVLHAMIESLQNGKVETAVKLQEMLRGLQELFQRSEDCELELSCVCEALKAIGSAQNDLCKKVGDNHENLGKVIRYAVKVEHRLVETTAHRNASEKAAEESQTHAKLAEASRKQAAEHAENAKHCGEKVVIAVGEASAAAKATSEDKKVTLMGAAIATASAKQAALAKDATMEAANKKVTLMGAAIATASAKQAALAKDATMEAAKRSEEAERVANLAAIKATAAAKEIEAKAAKAASEDAAKAKKLEEAAAARMEILQELFLKERWEIAAAARKTAKANADVANSTFKAADKACAKASESLKNYRNAVLDGPLAVDFKNFLNSPEGAKDVTALTSPGAAAVTASAKCAGVIDGVALFSSSSHQTPEPAENQGPNSQQPKAADKACARSISEWKSCRFFRIALQRQLLSPSYDIPGSCALIYQVNGPVE
eukprot:CAMPEP_0171983188 /NCGR_PEP_ID=MMETSP0993-20121228/273157_1 /TAXON_ID=483369 /ORGANISM="non described non described, Strain CCMP2098" /LENGTH=563 /DNA_ID=CAMNT_0012635931 /DNA_START=198 /DNA_END=1890 /DNA_ORIENTATION=+